MADISTTIKDAFAKGMEAIGSAASNIASNTRFRVDEMNLMSRRNELLNSFGAKAYALWQSGVQLPAELNVVMEDVQRLDEELARIRAEHLPREDAASLAEEASPVLVVREETAPVEAAPLAETASLSEAAPPVEVAPVTDDATPVLDMPETVTEVAIEAEALPEANE